MENVFEAIYSRWLQGHARKRRGESRRRIGAGLGHAERLFVFLVWLPLFGNLDDLHPEYEVRDLKDGTRFLDFAFIRSGFRVCIEIDPFGTHARDIDRWKHDDHLDRQNDLMVDNWKVLRYSLDKIQKSPRQVQLKLHFAISKWESETNHRHLPNPIDQAIVNFFEIRDKPTGPADVTRELGWSKTTASRHLRKLSEDQIIVPLKAGGQRVTRYILNRQRKNR